MGIILADIELANARQDDLSPMTVNCLVDSGAVHLCIPQHVASQLELPVLNRREVTVANGARQTVDYVGPLRVRFANRECLTGALVLGDQALLGAIPMEDMDLVIHPAWQILTVNPASPNIAMSLAMGVRPASKDLRGLEIRSCEWISSWRTRRSGPSNNWQNEGFMANQDGKSWSEIDGTIGNSAPPRRTDGSIGSRN